MGYVDENTGSGYNAELDLYEITDETMTDTGERVGELEPIEACVLSPGHPSPVGRTADGDLAYPVLPQRGSLDLLPRKELLLLAHLRLKHSTLEELPTYPLQNEEEIAVMSVMTDAVPQVLFEDTGHGQMAYQDCLKAVKDGDIDKALGFFKI